MTMAYDPHADWAREDREAEMSAEQAINEALLDAVEAVEALRPLFDKVQASGMWDGLRGTVRSLEEMHSWSRANRGWTTAEVL